MIDFSKRKPRNEETESPIHGVGRLLLSALKDPDNPGLHPADPDASELFHRLGEGGETLNRIMEKLSGSCTRRESLPTVMAQEKLFEMCIKNYGDNKDAYAPKSIVDQWKGAVAACLLDEDIFLFSPLHSELVTVQKSATSAHEEGNKQLSTEVADSPDKADKPADQAGLMPQKNGINFIDCIYQALGNEPKSWAIQCVRGDQSCNRLPMYQSSDDLIAIPAANLNALVNVTAKGVSLLSLIPWLKPVANEQKDIRFADPLPYLENHQLTQLEQRLKDFQTKHSKSEYLNALERFRIEISTYSNKEFEANCHKFKSNLLIALSLRDALDCTLTVKKHPHNDAEKGQFYILLMDTPLASLSEEELIVLHHPCAYLNGSIGKTFIEAVNKLLGNSACCQRARSIAEKWLRRGRNHIASSVLKMLSPKEMPNASEVAPESHQNATESQTSNAPETAPESHQNMTEEQNTEIPIVLKRRYFNEKEVQLSDPFSDFNYQAIPALKHPEQFFSQNLLIFPLSPNPEERQSLYHMAGIHQNWFAVHEMKAVRDKQTQQKTESSPSAKQALLPLGSEGAHCLLPGGIYCMSKDRSENISITIEQRSEATHVSIAFRVEGATYLLANKYPKENTEEMQQRNTFSIGVWPDYIEHNAGQSLWTNYYTYLYLPDKTNTYHATIHFVDNATEKHQSAQKLAYAFGPFPTLEHWSIAQSSRFPLFVELTRNTDVVGVMPCLPRKDPQCKNSRAVLGIDFGMSATVGALLPDMDIENTAQLKDSIRSAGYNNTSDVQWQFNKTAGINKTFHHFIGEYLGVTGKNNPHGSMFTLVRRYDTDTKHDDDKLRPYYDGNIEFVGEQNVPIYDSHVFAGLKMAEQSKRREAHISLFLQQALEMYFYRCCQEGATSVDVRFAYPLAMSETARDLLSNQFYEICNALAKSTGLRLEALHRTSESKAVQTYFHEVRKNLTGMTWGSIAVTIDIGGGTTDFSIMRESEKPLNSTIADHYSTTLAGNTMFSHRLFDNPDLKAQIDKLSQDRSIAQAAGDSTPSLMVVNPDAVDDSASETTQRQRQLFCLVVDQNLRLGEPILQEMIRSQTSAIHQPLIFQLCLLFWFATMLYKGATPQPAAHSEQSPSLYVCIAGNGSTFYRYQSDEVKRKIQQTVSMSGIQLHIEESPQTKMEVAQGLLLMNPNELEVVHKQDSDHHPSNDSGDPQPLGDHRASIGRDQICDAFFAFLNQYAKQFTDHTCVTSFINDSGNQDLLRTEMKAKISDLNQLAAYLPQLCDKLEITESAQP